MRTLLNNEKNINKPNGDEEAFYVLKIKKKKIIPSS